MKTYFLLRLENGANKAIFTCKADSVEEAVQKFNPHCLLFQLNENGYAKMGDDISFCVAEAYDPLCQV